MSGCGSCQKWFWGPVRSGFGVLLGVVLGFCQKWFWGSVRSGFGVLLGVVLGSC